MSSTLDPATGRARITAKTLRKDRWWLPPLATFAGLAAWVIYATVRSFLRSDYAVPEYRYLSPFYSPCLSVGCYPEIAHFPRVLPDYPWLPYAILALPFVLLFRLSCYYYRKAYYRSFWLSPPACAVAEPHRRYTGETRLPLLAQNLHRYFFYAAVIIGGILTYDAAAAMVKADGHFGFGLGNIFLWVNAILLWCYTLGCHSCRSITGGRLNHFSKHPVRYRLWGYVSWLNARHMQFAWTTLATLAITDFYIMLVAAGWISDPRIVG